MPNIEEHLRKAIDEGKFDNLPGKGKPIRLDETNPHADPEWELAYHMLKEAGYTLPWIETIREIEADIASARQDLQRAWDWQQAALSEHRPAVFIQAEWERALAAFKDKLSGLNKRIRDYNLQVPNARFQRPILSLEGEVGKITASSE
jgi:DnaJ homolog subfamily C member 28